MVVSFPTPEISGAVMSITVIVCDAVDELPQLSVAVQVRVTEYSDREWQEYYAESFSLYISDPIVLRQLRRHVYDYFVAHHPR